MTSPTASAWKGRFAVRPELPRRLSYPLVGALLAIGVPLGLLLLRVALQGEPNLARIGAELEADPLAYVYVLAAAELILVGMGFVLGRREDELGELATTDGLTGLANRLVFERRLNEELARSLRYRAPLSLLLVDLDGLKGLNDAYGHRTGDAALRRIALGIESTCRKTDLGARVGGDEFAVLAPQTSAEEARGLAERLQRELRASVEGSPALSVSIGIAEAAAHDHDPEKLVAAADEALYAAKARGKDRSELWRPGFHDAGRTAAMFT